MCDVADTAPAPEPGASPPDVGAAAPPPDDGGGAPPDAPPAPPARTHGHGTRMASRAPEARAAAARPAPRKRRRAGGENPEAAVSRLRRGDATANLCAQLGLEASQQGLGRIGGKLAGHIGENKYVVGAADDGRSKCQSILCRAYLRPGEPRIGKKPPSVRWGHSPKTKWYHLGCAFVSFKRTCKKSKTITCVEDLEGFGSLDARDQRTIERLIAEHNEERGRCGREAPPPRPAVGDAGPATTLAVAAACLAPPSRPSSRPRYALDGLEGSSPRRSGRKRVAPSRPGDESSSSDDDDDDDDAYDGAGGDGASDPPPAAAAAADLLTLMAVASSEYDAQRSVERPPAVEATAHVSEDETSVEAPPAFVADVAKVVAAAARERAGDGRDAGAVAGAARAGAEAFVDAFEAALAALPPAAPAFCPLATT